VHEQLLNQQLQVKMFPICVAAEWQASGRIRPPAPHLTGPVLSFLPAPAPACACSPSTLTAAGNGSALRHFEATGRKYPLVVKLGTITPAGADVYSSAPDEDDMVLDPSWPEHLAHWGINMMQVRPAGRDKQPAAVQALLQHRPCRPA